MLPFIFCQKKKTIYVCIELLTNKKNDMREIKRIKLNQFSEDELDQRKMNALKGGCSCALMCTDCTNLCAALLDVIGDMSADMDTTGFQSYMNQDIWNY